MKILVQKKLIFNWEPYGLIKLMKGFKEYYLKACVCIRVSICLCLCLYIFMSVHTCTNVPLYILPDELHAHQRPHLTTPTYPNHLFPVVIQALLLVPSSSARIILFFCCVTSCIQFYFGHFIDCNFEWRMSIFFSWFFIWYLFIYLFCNFPNYMFVCSYIVLPLYSMCVFSLLRFSMSILWILSLAFIFKATL